MREPRDAADDDHREHEHAAEEKPRGHRATTLASTLSRMRERARRRHGRRNRHGSHFATRPSRPGPEGATSRSPASRFRASSNALAAAIRPLQNRERQEPRVIAHVDMDAFYASVELLRYPSCAGCRWSSAADRGISRSRSRTRLPGRADAFCAAAQVCRARRDHHGHLRGARAGRAFGDGPDEGRATRARGGTAAGRLRPIPEVLAAVQGGGARDRAADRGSRHRRNLRRSDRCGRPRASDNAVAPARARGGACDQARGARGDRPELLDRRLAEQAARPRSPRTWTSRTD